MSQYILYDRFFSLDETTGVLRTFWRIIGNNQNSIVQLRENQPIQTLNPFGQNIASLYVFCRPSQATDLERHQLVDIHRQYGTNLKIYKYSKHVTLANTSATLASNIDNIQSVLSMHTFAQQRIDITSAFNEPISKRVLYKFCFNAEKVRSELIEKFKFFALTSYPDLQMFVPFDDECEFFLNIVFPLNKHLDTTKYTYLTVVATHYMPLVPIIESLYGLVQVVNSRNISRNVMTVTNREPIKDLRSITDMFLDYVPIVDVIVGRVYENENCIEYNSAENAITFILVKIFIRHRTNYIVFMNRRFQATALPTTPKNINVIPSDNEADMLVSFFNLYTNGLIARTLCVDIHFILATPRYKSHSCVLMRRIIRNNLWTRFAPHSVVSEDGRCVRFNRNAIILFDNMERTGIVTNYTHIDNKVIYLPELYNDSTVPIESSLAIHCRNIRNEFATKYIDVVRMLERDAGPPPTMTLYELVTRIIESEAHTVNDYSLILESIIELANKIRIPITMLYAVAPAQIAYRLIFYTNLRAGTFTLLDRSTTRQPSFYQVNNNGQKNNILNALKNLSLPQTIEIYSNGNGTPTSSSSSLGTTLFQNLIRKYIPVHMMGNLMENYFNFFCPGENYFPLVSTLVDNESELLNTRNAVLWSRKRMYVNKSIVSFDFRLYNCTLVSLFDLDFNNCAMMYGFELKSFFNTLFPDAPLFEFNKMRMLQLPHTFIMDNDTLQIVNIVAYNDIEQKLNDQSMYIVIMSFITDSMLRTCNPNYQTLAYLFRTNINDLSKYKTRLTLHKNILNSICGMLSTYEINTTILNIVNALARKLILWTVENCLQTAATDDTYTSLLEHKYIKDKAPPSNLVAIENDSFTFVYDNHQRFKYGMGDNANDEDKRIEEIRARILDRLINELAKCTTRSIEEIRQIVDLKLNFATGSLFQVSQRKYYYLQRKGSTDTLEIVSNEHSNRKTQKSLLFLNRNRKLVDLMRRGAPLKFSYFKHTYNFTDTRRLLLWYTMQLRQNIDIESGGMNHQQVTLHIFGLLNEFLQQTSVDETELNRFLNFLFYAIKITNTQEYFINAICMPAMNIHFQIFTVPERRVYETSTLIPSDKKLMVFNCIDIFFKLYAKLKLIKQQHQQPQP